MTDLWGSQYGPISIHMNSNSSSIHLPINPDSNTTPRFILKVFSVCWLRVFRLDHNHVKHLHYGVGIEPFRARIPPYGNAIHTHGLLNINSCLSEGDITYRDLLLLHQDRSTRQINKMSDESRCWVGRPVDNTPGRSWSPFVSIQRFSYGSTLAVTVSVWCWIIKAPYWM
jgi:hypothetical protein